MNVAALPSLKRNSRQLICGPTGCGKSVKARADLKSQRHVFAIDTKWNWDWEEPHPYWSLRAERYADLVKLAREVEQPDGPFYGAPIVVRLDPAAPAYHAELDAVAALAMKRGNTLLYYDELSDVCTSGNYEVIAPNYRRAVQVGRGLGVGVWACSQRPQRIPVIAGSEADVRVTFFLRNPDDQKRMESFMGPVPWKLLAQNKHSFVIATDETSQSDSGLTPHRLILDTPSTMQRSA